MGRNTSDFLVEHEAFVCVGEASWTKRENYKAFYGIHKIFCGNQGE